MREIKFRVWNGANIEYDVTVGKFGTFYVNPENGDGLNPKDTASLTTCTTKYSDTTPVMQFSGVQDKNQKEIYDRDIVLMKDGNKGIVKFCHQRVGFYIDYQIPPFRANYSQNFNVTYGDGKNYIDSTIEVIGNIYENPELTSNG